MINVVFAINEAYVKQLRVVLRSLLCHMDNATIYHVYILHYNVQEQSQSLILSEFHSYHSNSSLEFVKLSDEQHTRIPFVGRWGKETNFRLLLPELIPQIDKAIYLDTDVLILSDLTDLFNVSLDDYLLAATMEERLGYRNYTISQFMVESENEQLLFSPHRTPYLNAGVLVLNVALMRQKKFTEHALYLLSKLPHHWFENSRYDFFLMPDQDILYYLANQYSKGIYYLPDRYNHIVGYYYYKDMPKFVSQEQYSHWLGYVDSLAGEASNREWVTYQPAIIHYADSAPWNKKRGLVPYEKLYRSYAKQIGWKLPNKWLINTMTWFKRRYFYSKTTRDAWGRKGMALLVLNMMVMLAISLYIILAIVH